MNKREGTIFVTPTEELLYIVDSLISRGAVAIEVSVGDRVIKCNIARSPERVLGSSTDDAVAAFEADLYYSAEQEGLEQ